MNAARILALTDLSKESQAGLDLAHALAHRLDARVTLGHVHVRSGWLRSVVPDDPAAGRLEAWAFREEEEHLRHLGRGQPPSLRADDIRIVDAPSIREGVVLLEECIEPDLICMSAHGHTGSEHSLVGSTTEHMVRNARVPVLVTRRGSFPGPRDPLRVVVGVDLLADPSRLGRKVAGLLGPRDSMLLVHAVEPQVAYSALAYGPDFVPPQPDVDGLVSAAQLRLRQVHLGRDAPRLSIKVRRGDPGGVLCTTAREWDAHLVVVRTHGRRVYNRMLLGSVSEFLLRKCRSPVLIYPKTY